MEQLLASSNGPQLLQELLRTLRQPGSSLCADLAARSGTDRSGLSSRADDPAWFEGESRGRRRRVPALVTGQSSQAGARSWDERVVREIWGKGYW